MPPDREPIVVLVDGRIDLGTVDALCRLQRAVRLLGGRVLLRDAPGELFELLGFAGLLDVFPSDLRRGGGEAEEREEFVGVEEEADP